MEEQRARQEDEARKAVAASVSDVNASNVQKMEGPPLHLLILVLFLGCTFLCPAMYSIVFKVLRFPTMVILLFGIFSSCKVWFLK